MQQAIVTHVQDSIRPGECVDMYYPNGENSEKQCHATTVENRYSVSLQSTQGGSSNTVLFNPDEGINHMCLILKLNAPDATNAPGLAAPRGWGYAMIDRIGVRYGGSTLYYFDGSQMLIDVLSDCEDSVKRDTMFTLGGQEITNTSAANGWANEAMRTAYVYLKLPHNSPSAQELPLPFPTDLLTSPVQIQITFKRFEDVILVNGNNGAEPPVAYVLPAAMKQFDSASVQFKQVHFDDTGEQLARRVNMDERALPYPLKYFSQEIFRSQSLLGGVTQNITLTGLRSGNCLGIRLWAKPIDTVGQPFNYVAPKQVTLSVNGLVYFDAREGQQTFWNLVDRKTAAAWNNSQLAYSAGAYSSTPASSYWVEIPFAQHEEVLANENALVHGLSIMNSIINLQVALPPYDVVPGSGSGDGRYVVSAEYLFNATLLISRGTCEYVF